MSDPRADQVDELIRDTNSAANQADNNAVALIAATLLASERSYNGLWCSDELIDSKITDAIRIWQKTNVQMRKR